MNKTAFTLIFLPIFCSGTAFGQVAAGQASVVSKSGWENFTESCNDLITVFPPQITSLTWKYSIDKQTENSLLLTGAISAFEHDAKIHYRAGNFMKYVETKKLKAAGNIAWSGNARLEADIILKLTSGDVYKWHKDIEAVGYVSQPLSLQVQDKETVDFTGATIEVKHIRRNSEDVLSPSPWTYGAGFCEEVAVIINHDMGGPVSSVVNGVAVVVPNPAVGRARAAKIDEYDRLISDLEQVADNDEVALAKFTQIAEDNWSGMGHLKTANAGDKKKWLFEKLVHEKNILLSEEEAGMESNADLQAAMISAYSNCFQVEANQEKQTVLFLKPDGYELYRKGVLIKKKKRKTVWDFLAFEEQSLSSYKISSDAGAFCEYDEETQYLVVHDLETGLVIDKFKLNSAYSWKPGEGNPDILDIKTTEEEEILYDLKQKKVLAKWGSKAYSTDGDFVARLSQTQRNSIEVIDTKNNKTVAVLPLTGRWGEEHIKPEQIRILHSFDNKNLIVQKGGKALVFDLPTQKLLKEMVLENADPLFWLEGSNDILHQAQEKGKGVINLYDLNNENVYSEKESVSHEFSEEVTFILTTSGSLKVLDKSFKVSGQIPLNTNKDINATQRLQKIDGDLILCTDVFRFKNPGGVFNIQAIDLKTRKHLKNVPHSFKIIYWAWVEDGKLSVCGADEYGVPVLKFFDASKIF